MKKTFVIGFTGRYPERKGLPIIAEAIRLMRRSGYNIRLNVIGKCHPEIAQQDGITHFGVIDKGVGIARFIDIIGISISGACFLAPN